jgi:hypothetical protein
VNLEIVKWKGKELIHGKMVMYMLVYLLIIFFIDFLIGEFLDNIKHGKGTYYYAEKSMYDGLYAYIN